MVTVQADPYSGLDYVLAHLMERYGSRVGDVTTIIQAMIRESFIKGLDDIENDHIAFRTFGVRHLGIGSIQKIFRHYGYERRERYDFPAKKLTAYWYSPPLPKFPRIFVSELRVAELSEGARDIVASYTSEVHSDPVDEIDLDDPMAVDAFLHRPLWRLPTFADYRRLAEENEYAAWVIFNRYYLNHFTISVHNLPAAIGTLERFDAFVERHGVTLNDSGGKIKRSADGLLLQSATVAELVEAEFAGGERHMIPGSYVEFAERLVDPAYRHLKPEEITRAHRRDGFETGNADRIFESTYVSQTLQRVQSTGAEDAD